MCFLQRFLDNLPVRISWLAFWPGTRSWPSRQPARLKGAGWLSHERMWGCSLPDSSLVVTGFSLRTCTTLTRQTWTTQKTARHKRNKKLSGCNFHQKYFYKVLCYTSASYIFYASKNKNLNSWHLPSEIDLLRFFYASISFLFDASKNQNQTVGIYHQE